MFTLAQQSPAARRLIALAVTASVAAGTAGSVAAGDARAMSCAVKGSYTTKACGIPSDGESYPTIP